MLNGPEAPKAGSSFRLCCVVMILVAVVALSSVATASADPVIAAAGDIACSTSSQYYNGGAGTSTKCRQRYTSDLLINSGLSAVLPLGDAQYETGSLSGFTNSYGPTWGRAKPITFPAAGNHEYKTSGAKGYFDYFNGVGSFGGPAGDRDKGYYSFDVGTWHLIALNSSDHCQFVKCGKGSPQETWLKADLAAHPTSCTLAFWHHPRFNSGHDGNATFMQALFQDLYDANADVVLAGHAHDYERFAPQDPSGRSDRSRGIRQFVVGTGGAFFTALGTTKPNSQVRNGATYGVLMLTLHPTSYDWKFVPEAGKKFTDSGSASCHGTIASAATAGTGASPAAGLPQLSGRALRAAPCSITGTAGKDLLVGTSGQDVICGLAGGDRISSGAGNDLIRGGAGRDRIRAGDGNDILLGQSGNDRLFGDRGRNRLYGGRGRDWAKVHRGDAVRSVERRVRARRH
jgi:Ca2+-binding RTX toxin-like protein